jgi:hypothetical protein
MYAVVVKVTVNDVAGVTEAIPRRVMPMVASNPGLVHGYFTRKDKSGLGMFVYESKDYAERAHERISTLGQHLPSMVALDDVELRHVIAGL